MSSVVPATIGQSTNCSAISTWLTEEEQITSNTVEMCILCTQEIFIACPLCLVALCFDHSDSTCKEHNAILYSEGFHIIYFYPVIVAFLFV
jgi:hypothetical protein